MKALSELAKDALELPASQRLTLARMLLDLPDGDPLFSSDSEAAWEDELVRRMETVKSGAAHSTPLEDVFARLDRDHAL